MEWPRPVARSNLRSGRAFSGDVMNCGVWMSPVMARWRIVRCILSSWHSQRRWCEVARSMLHGQGSAVMLGGGLVGARLQKTHQRACVSAHSTSWRCLGKVKDGMERGS